MTITARARRTDFAVTLPVESYVERVVRAKSGPRTVPSR